MSVTFCCPDAPSRLGVCPYCADARANGDLDYCDVREGVVYCDPTCPGTAQISESPEVNVSNSNAAVYLRILGLPYSEYGTIPSAAVSAAIRATVRALNTDEAERHVVQPSVDADPDRATMIDGGLSAELIDRRINQLQELFVYAAKHGYDVSFG